jgi:nitric oxide reductase activation protein
VGNLDDFDDRKVVEVPKKLLEEVAEAIAHEIEDLSQSVAEALAEDPRSVAASARKADDDPELARRVTSQVMPQVQEIRRVFDRQQDIQSRYLKGLDRGKLDDRRLARVGAGSLNVFQRRQVLERPDLAVGLLLDVSGSMSGFMHVVEETAAVFAEGLIRKPGVNFAAWTYTGGYAHVELTRICDRRLGKLCLGNVAKGGGTPSGAAIAGVKVLMERMAERKKVLIHFTDGQPDSSHHVERAVQACRQAGIRVYAIGVGTSMGGSLESQYGKGNWEVISAVAELPQAVARLLKRLDSFGSGERRA